MSRTEWFLFEALRRHATERPESVAVVDWNREVTYRELEARVRLLGGYLEKQGIGPGSLVGVCTERSVEGVVGILGVLAAGAAYLPLSPQDPLRRLGRLVSDADPCLVLTVGRASARLDGIGVPLLRLDEEWDVICQCGDALRARRASDDDMAYVLYTSGTTKQAKGVMISRANLGAFVPMVCSALGLREDDVVLHAASLTHVVAMRQVLTALFRGARLVVTTVEDVLDPRRVFELVRREGVTVMDVVPSYWRACTEALSELSPRDRSTLLDSDLRLVISVGEPLPSATVMSWWDRCGARTAVVNIYGQTETTGMISAFPVTPGALGVGGVVPVGWAVGDCRMHLLDEDHLPVADGEVGELFAAGPTVAMGYLNQPEETEMRFVDLSAGRRQARVCRTGDLGRRLEDGSILLCGRADGQLKVRGVRVEPAEVEAALLECPGVVDCAVVAGDDGRLAQGLDAYVVVRSGATLSRDRVRSQLSEALPDAMIPGRLIEVVSLPRTPSGKLDRGALAPVLSQPHSVPCRGPSRLALTREVDLARWFWQPGWVRAALGGASYRDRGPRTVLLFLDAQGLGDRLAGALNAGGSCQVKVVAPAGSSGLRPPDFELDPGDPAGYRHILAALSRDGAFPDDIVHLWSLNAEDDEDAAKRLGLESLVRLAQALDRFPERAVDLTVVSSGVYEVTGRESLQPANALVLGPCRVIPLELPGVRCRHVDIGLPGPGSGDGGALAAALAGEIRARTDDDAVSLRGADRWVQSWVRASIPAGGSCGPALRRGGSYLITGGLGGIGLAVAEHLARVVRARLTLVTRSGFPEPAGWESWLETHPPGDTTAHRIRILQRIAGTASGLQVVQADVTREVEVREALLRSMQSFGPLHGLVHAAGVRGSFSLIPSVTPEAVDRVLAPKVDGTRVVCDAVRGQDLDFVVLFSSISSILGRLGQTDYCAANAYQDAFSWLARRHGQPVLSVNWDTWRDMGMAAEADVAPELAALREEAISRGIRVEEGVEAFSRLLGAGAPQVVVSTVDLEARRSRLATERSTVRESRHQGPAEGGGDLRRAVAEIWSEVLGVEDITSEDDFFDLGGDSLAAMRVIARIRSRWGAETSITEFFARPTVAAVAEAVRGSLERDGDGDGDIEEILARVEGLSDDEATRLLESLTVAVGKVGAEDRESGDP